MLGCDKLLVLYNLIIYEIPIADIKSIKHDLHKRIIASVYTLNRYTVAVYNIETIIRAIDI